MTGRVSWKTNYTKKLFLPVSYQSAKAQVTYLALLYLLKSNSHLKGGTAMAFALTDSIINDFSLDVLQSFTPDLQWLPCHSLASGPLASPHESEHVGADKCASLWAQMMRQCIYISLVKQERWHNASTEAQTLQQSIWYICTIVRSGLAWLQTDS